MLELWAPLYSTGGRLSLRVSKEQRPGAAVVSFLFQSLALFTSAVLALGFTFRFHVQSAWLCVALFALLFLVGFRNWRRGDSPPSAEGS